MKNGEDVISLAIATKNHITISLFCADVHMVAHAIAYHAVNVIEGIAECKRFWRTLVKLENTYDAVVYKTETGIAR